jgi:uncharacterized protein YbjT (DUF2867 family)
MHRRPEQADVIAATGAIPILGDLVHDSIDELATKMAGQDAVVFSAGSHGGGREQTTLIDGEGVRRSARAASQAGVTRFVLVSAFADSERGNDLGEDFEHYIAVKRSAEIDLVTTDLDWIIVRPGHLLDDPGRGAVSAALALVEAPIARDDVAAFIVAALDEPRLARTIVELTAGGTPVRQAAADVAASVGPRA